MGQRGPRAADRVYGPYTRGRRYLVIARGPGVAARSGGSSELRTYYDTHAEALAGAARWQALLATHYEARPGDALDAWTKAQEERGVLKRTIADYRYRLGPLLERSGITRILDLDREHIESWLDGEYTGGGERSVDTRRGHLAVLRRAVAWWREHGYLPRDPSAGIEIAGRKAKGKAQLTVAEARLLDAACGAAGDDEAMAVHLLLWTGARSRELLTMRHRDLDFGADPVVWYIPYAGGDDEGAKTEAGARAVELPDVLAKRLQMRLNGKPLEAWVWPAARNDSDSGHRSATWLRAAVLRMCLAAKVRVVTPHGLRGTHGTLLRVAGVPVSVVASGLGHTSPQVTAAHYVDKEAGRVVDMRAAQRRLRKTR